MSVSAACAGGSEPASASEPAYRVLVVVDGAAVAAALAEGGRIADRHGAEVALVAVVDQAPPADDPGRARRQARARVLAAGLSLPADLHPAEFVETGPPAAAIARVARAWEPDLVIAGADVRLDSVPCRMLVVAAAPDDTLSTDHVLAAAGPGRRATP